MSLINRSNEFKFLRKIVNIIATNFNRTKIKVKIANTTSQSVKLNTGHRQGDALSPVLCNLVLKKVIREMNISEGIALG